MIHKLATRCLHCHPSAKTKGRLLNQLHKSTNTQIRLLSNPKIRLLSRAVQILAWYMVHGTKLLAPSSNILGLSGFRSVTVTWEQMKTTTEALCVTTNILAFLALYSFFKEYHLMLCVLV